MHKLTALITIIVLMAFACTNQTEKEKGNMRTEALMYPETKMVDTIDTYHGVAVKDPYRWLEVDTAAEVETWVDAQNEVTFGYLKQIEYKEKIAARLEELMNYERYSQPFRKGKYYFFYKNNGLQNQSVLYVQDGLDGDPRVLLDPNTFSEDGTVALGGLGFTEDGEKMAYSISKSGSDWREIKTLKVATGEALSDHVKWVKFSGISFWKDGFYYSRYDKPAEGKEYSSANEFHKIYYHKLGTPQSDDKLIFEDTEHPRRNFYGYVTEDKQYLIIGGSEGTSGNTLRIKKINQPNADFVTIVDNFSNDHSVIGSLGDTIYMVTNQGAPNKRLVSFTLNNPQDWKTVIPESNEKVLKGVSMAAGKLFAKYMVDAQSRIEQYTPMGQLEQVVELPTVGSAGGFGGHWDDAFVFYTFTSFTYPPTIYKYFPETGKSELFRQSSVKFNPDNYESKQVFYTSKDGTKVPMFIVHKKGLELDGTNPTWLYAYGGFNISLTPSFSASQLAWLEQGGVYAQPSLRGGGEYGEKWHKAGMKEQKQNVFDDFIAAAEYLIDNKYTSSQRLAMRGGSNGGLLVGAVMAQRPNLMKVALPAVGVMDMLRFHKFTIGWAWAVEYGNADSSKTEFEYLKAYSPLHNLKPGIEYPATMVTTADHDDRVVPAHSFKFIAALQAAHKGQNPVLIRIEKKAGHGAGKPISKVIEELADQYAFAWHNMGFEPTYNK